MIQIRAVDKFNFWDVGELTSNADGVATVLEEYICCNAFSIAESHFYPEYQPRALYQGEVLIGFFMYKILADKPNEAFICRFMLDHKFIGQGLGNQSFLRSLNISNGSE
ncbi:MULTISPECIES: GNAT family N-acetyltransferase [Providencia]|uniref:GNAT family N-acetyltransferase n=1 Tax=Providencia TaxID=586 RepID=UPI00197D6C44|nr:MULTISPECIES: GNAT family N-acetyltransferase [Providencia]MBN4865336.1 GNAT family N-acetyltransferase [Providencia stuartii]MBN4874439.1 GNAT family N-acetyltransferase [Providencia stuartii]MBN4879349.1 GNAT family N-acetyltransferase [Providencia stuartii]MBN4883640.1 GNAT family N-acetyltransferase [Providencia stuartii]